MAVVEHGQLAQRISHSLVRSGYLEKEENFSVKCYIFMEVTPLQKEILTSFPMRSSLFSRIPHGAIPIAQTFPRDLEEWSFKASPT